MKNFSSNKKIYNFCISDFYRFGDFRYRKNCGSSCKRGSNSLYQSKKRLCTNAPTMCFGRVGYDASLICATKNTVNYPVKDGYCLRYISILRDIFG